MFKKFVLSAVSVISFAAMLMPSAVSAHHGSASGKCVDNVGVITAKFEAWGDRSNLLGNITVSINDKQVDAFKATADNFTKTYKPYANGTYTVKAAWVMDWNKNGKVDSGETFSFTNTVKIEKCEPKVEMCTVAGKGHLPKNDPNCKEDEKCIVTGKTHLPKNDPACKEEPQVLPATTLPVTGSGSTLGLAVLAVVVGSYIWKARRLSR